MFFDIAGYGSGQSAVAHNHRITGSNPVPATKNPTLHPIELRCLLYMLTGTSRGSGQKIRDLREY